MSSAAFNALSFLLPQGEKYFIDVAKEVSQTADFSGNPGLKQEVELFISQESIHAKQHRAYNANLEKQGYENVVYGLLEFLINFSYRHMSPLTRLAIVCGYEHYTAILGDFILSKPQILAKAESEMALMWGWHAAEESEHKSVCFDLYKLCGGGWLRRIAAFTLVSLQFLYLFYRLFWHMLYRDGSLAMTRLPQTLKQIVKFFFGRDGVNWHIYKFTMDYYKPGFHPDNLDNDRLLETWLERNHERLDILDTRQVS
ncbi:MAG: hypothetical protein GKR95_18865 [Gammaproteobacteria bacterium]|nr:hypothetical protein [Gammaproteobacteria bacterium]